MIEFWLSKYWPLLAIVIIFAVVLVLCIKEDIAKNNSKEWENPMDAALRALGIFISGVCVLVGLVAGVVFLHEVANEYGKTYTMIVDIHYSPNKVVSKTFVSENESFRIEYYNSGAKISGADGVYLRVNAPIDIVSNTYTQNK